MWWVGFCRHRGASRKDGRWREVLERVGAIPSPAGGSYCSSGQTGSRVGALAVGVREANEREDGMSEVEQFLEQWRRATGKPERGRPDRGV